MTSWQQHRPQPDQNLTPNVPACRTDSLPLPDAGEIHSLWGASPHGLKGAGPTQTTSKGFTSRQDRPNLWVGLPGQPSPQQVTFYKDLRFLSKSVMKTREDVPIGVTRICASADRRPLGKRTQRPGLPLLPLRLTRLPHWPPCPRAAADPRPRASAAMPAWTPHRCWLRPGLPWAPRPARLPWCPPLSNAHSHAGHLPLDHGLHEAQWGAASTPQREAAGASGSGHLRALSIGSLAGLQGCPDPRPPEKASLLCRAPGSCVLGVCLQDSRSRRATRCSLSFCSQDPALPSSRCPLDLAQSKVWA